MCGIIRWIQKRPTEPGDLSLFNDRPLSLFELDPVPPANTIPIVIDSSDDSSEGPPSVKLSWGGVTFDYFANFC